MEKGLKHISTTTVTAANTALTMGSGDMEVFATPAMVALMENAAMKAVAPHLPEGSTTVGAMMQTSHIKPSAPGETVTAEAVLQEVDGRKLTFRGNHRRRHPHPLYSGPRTLPLPLEAIAPLRLQYQYGPFRSNTPKRSVFFSFHILFRFHLPLWRYILQNASRNPP